MAAKLVVLAKFTRSRLHAATTARASIRTLEGLLFVWRATAALQSFCSASSKATEMRLSESR